MDIKKSMPLPRLSKGLMISIHARTYPGISYNKMKCSLSVILPQ